MAGVNGTEPVDDNTFSYIKGIDFVYIYHLSYACYISH